MLRKSEKPYAGFSAGAFVATPTIAAGPYEVVVMKERAAIVNVLLAVSRFGPQHGVFGELAGEPRPIGRPADELVDFGNASFQWALIEAVESVHGPLLWAVTARKTAVWTAWSEVRAHLLLGFSSDQCVAVLGPTVATGTRGRSAHSRVAKKSKTYS